jgi:transketolase
MIEIAVALYYHHMKHDPKNPEWKGRDRLVLGKAHCAAVLYACLGDLGYFDKEKWLDKYAQWHSILQFHADRWSVPGIEYTGGSLGQGLSYAVGMALASMIKAPQMGPYITAMRRQPSYRVYCICGDGETMEGQVWCAAMTASTYKIWNLINIIDYNKMAGTGLSQGSLSLVNLEPMADKWRAFGWNVIECNGNDMTSVLDALEYVDVMPDDKPKCIIAHTIKGKGIPRWEEERLHSISFDKESYKELLKCLE